ncbi:MAG: rod shape-determining protein RodA [Candidatus Omnitrophica bacterium]|nr:rod shape-determining protein RodA [Candidatus Omnitrophota bacterium]
MRILANLGLFLAPLLITLIGISSIYSATYFKKSNLWILQLIWLILGSIIFWIMNFFNYRYVWEISFFLYVVCMILLLVVSIYGAVRLGAQRWISILGFNFQPTEFAKLVLVIILARYFSRKSPTQVTLPNKRLGIFKALIFPFILVLLPVILILEQPDLGSALILIFIFVGMIYFADIKSRYIFLFMGLCILSFPIFWHFLKDYQKDRLLVFLNPNLDPLGSGYTLIQSKISIGSGRLLGKGWLSGTQSQLLFLPEAHTDFIFATFAEERGFLGCVLLFSLYYLLIREIIQIGYKASDDFAKLLSLGIGFSLGIQILINISMTMGLLPVVGVPLPFLSYGGSSLVINFLSLGILSNIKSKFK